MDNKDQVTSNPDMTADQATPDVTNEAPTATAEGSSAAAVDTPNANAQANTATANGTDTEASTGTTNATPSTPSVEAAKEEVQTVNSTTDTAVTDSEATNNEANSSPAAAEDRNTSDAANQAASSEASGDNITMEDVMAASDDQLSRPPVHRGMTVNGTIIMMGQEGIVVDVGAKIEGTLPYNQLFEFEVTPEDAKKYFKAGDEITVYIVRSDIPNNQIILSKKRADAERAWNLLQEIFDKKLPVEVEVVEKVRGGLVANLGVRAFLPASQVDIRRISDLDPYVGKRLKVKIIELNRKRNRVIVSRRAVLEEEMSGVKEETLKKLEPGAQLEGEVVEITDFGAFVNLGGIDGLVHRSELTHGRFNHPKEVVELGQKVKIEVLDMDLERERINLSMKKLMGNPWEEVMLNYTIGQKVEGKVTNLTQFGAFVEIEPGLEGLIHVSEMSWTKRIRHPKEVVSEGEDVEAMILKVDQESQRISLGLRQTQPDPWSSLPDRFPPGTEVTGPITGITEFGVFMEIEEGIEGLVHISELAHEHIEDISETFSRGDEVSAVILNIDPVEQRASLSRKRLLPYTAGTGATDAGGMPMGAPSSRGGGRKGRRGGRRSQGIDYDYSSYSSDSSSSKATTKLGDVYADLFAQFGLADSSTEDEVKESDAKETDKAEAKTDAKADSSDYAKADSSSADSSSDATSNDTETKEASPEVKAADETLEKNLDTSAQAPGDNTEVSEDEVDPENAIDAAEAAALLTAAFRDGKRPAVEAGVAADGASSDAASADKPDNNSDTASAGADSSSTSSTADSSAANSSSTDSGSIKSGSANSSVADSSTTTSSADTSNAAADSSAASSASADDSAADSDTATTNSSDSNEVKSDAASTSASDSDSASAVADSSESAAAAPAEIDYNRYVEDVKKYASGDVDEDRVKAIVNNFKGVLQNRDAMLVACSQKDELEHVREKFLRGKLNRTESDEDLDAAIGDICETMKETRAKNRVTFYYLLTDKLGAQDYWA